MWWVGCVGRWVDGGTKKRKRHTYLPHVIHQDGAKHHHAPAYPVQGEEQPAQALSSSSLSSSFADEHQVAVFLAQRLGAQKDREAIVEQVPKGLHLRPQQLRPPGAQEGLGELLWCCVEVDGWVDAVAGSSA